MTGFRVALGGAQQRFGIKPDLTTLGKIIGGGLPIAAYGGRIDIMRKVAPLGPVYQAGTLSGNPLAMTAGLATIRALHDMGIWLEIVTMLIPGFNDSPDDSFPAGQDAMGRVSSFRCVASAP